MMEITLNASGEKAERGDIADALRHAADQIEEGYIEGDLRNESLEDGYWKLK